MSDFQTRVILKKRQLRRMWTVFVLLLLFVVGVYAGKDYYSILGVSRDANDKQLKKAYHKMSKKYHPDRSDDPDAQDRFMEAANGKTGSFILL